MTRVRCILVDTTVPVRIRPRIETWPVKGHFLSDPISINSNNMHLFLLTDIGAFNGRLRCPEA